MRVAIADDAVIRELAPDKGAHHGFCRMIGVIETDADELSRAGNAWSQPRRAGYVRKRSKIKRFELRKASRIQHRTFQIRHYFTQVSNCTLGVE